MSFNTQTIFAPKDPIAGFSQANLGDQWWQYVDRIPYTEHFGAFDDTTDPRGRRGSVEKALLYQPLLSGSPQDRVLFIGGAFGNLPQGISGAFTVQRTVILPEGTTKVFFPLFNNTATNLTTTPKKIDVTDPFVNGGRNNAQLKENAAFYMNQPGAEGTGTSALFAKVDGQNVKDPYQYRQTSQGKNGFNAYPIKGGISQEYLGYQPDTTYLTNPELKGQVPSTPDNPNGYPTIKDLGGYNNLPNGANLAIKTFADGYWLGTDLNPGEHTLNFGGTFSKEKETNFALDITYNILNPVKGTQKGDVLTGTELNDYIDGGNGKDKLLG
ncbi:MAG TPA: hypothetical protein V6C57_10525, partial [Coleofasciculaceae cyanobacterium]